MKKTIYFNEQRTRFIRRDEDDFGKRWGLSKNSIGAIDIITYKGYVTVDADYIENEDVTIGSVDDKTTREHNFHIDWTIKIALSDVINHSFDVQAFKTNAEQQLNALGIKVLEVKVENAVQELFEVSDRQFTPHVLCGDKESLVLDGLDKQSEREIK